MLMVDKEVCQDFDPIAGCLNSMIVSTSALSHSEETYLQVMSLQHVHHRISFTSFLPTRNESCI